MDPELIVKGQGDVRALPDLATLHVTIDGEGHSQEEAYRRAASAANEVDRALFEFQAAIERVTTANLAVQPRTRWRRGESQRTGWQASRRSVVEVTDTSRVGDLINSLVGAGAEIDSISWSVTPDNESIALARRRAGEDARARAEQYAEALGVELGSVVWAAEPGLRRADGRSGPTHFAVPMAAAAQAADAGIDVSPAEITIVAELEVGFRIAPPDSSPS